jgi:hypothetical protein
MRIEKIHIKPRSKRQHTDYKCMEDGGHDQYNAGHFGLYAQAEKNVRDMEDDFGEI